MTTSSHSVEVAKRPSPQVSEGGTKYSFTVQHVPEVENYSHSEVRVLKNSVFNPKLDLSRRMKEILKARLAEKMEVISGPSSG